MPRISSKPTPGAATKTPATKSTRSSAAATTGEVAPKQNTRKTVRRTRTSGKTVAKAATKATAKVATKATTKATTKAIAKGKIKASSKASTRAPAKVPVNPKAMKAKAKRSKTVRDSFNMPEADYALIGQLKKRALASAREVKKSELLRAGLRLLASLGEQAFHAALAVVPAIKTGRPKK